MKCILNWFRSKSTTEPASTKPEPEFPYINQAFDITGKFEGHGFSTVAGDFDGMGISVGFLQWNYGTGSLQSKILKPYLSKHGSIDELGIFPDKIDFTATASPGEALAYARSVMLSGRLVRSNWVTSWINFLLLPEVIDIQQNAAISYAQTAKNLCAQYAFTGPKAFCFFFDVAVQNGSMKGIIRPEPDYDVAGRYIAEADDKNKFHWAGIYKKCDHESITLFMMGFSRARLSRSEYFKDVLSRKGTIALGSGTVHGQFYKLF